MLYKEIIILFIILSDHLIFVQCVKVCYLSEQRRYCDARRHAVCVCVSAEPRLHAHRISLRGEGNALYPMLSSLSFVTVNIILHRRV